MWSINMASYIFSLRIQKQFCAALSSLIILLCLPVAAKRNDLVIMKNGDRFTGEVKKLEHGVLYVDLPYVSGSVGFDWLQVERVQSTGRFQVVLNNGERVAGTIEKKSSAEAPDKDFAIHAAHGEVRAAAPDVVTVESQKRGFWRQLTGAIDLGYNFSSGNSQTSLSADANANYLTQKWIAGRALSEPKFLSHGVRGLPAQLSTGSLTPHNARGRVWALSDSHQSQYPRVAGGCRLFAREF
jgi:hypothetical protein